MESLSDHCPISIDLQIPGLDFVAVESGYPEEIETPGNTTIKGIINDIKEDLLDITIEIEALENIKEALLDIAHELERQVD